MFGISMKYGPQSMFDLVFKCPQDLDKQLTYLEILLNGFVKCPQITEENAVQTHMCVIRNSLIPIRINTELWDRLPKNVKKEYPNPPLADIAYEEYGMAVDSCMKNPRHPEKTYIQGMYADGYLVFWVDFEKKNIKVDNVFRQPGTKQGEKDAQINGKVADMALRPFVTIPFCELNDLTRAVAADKPIRFVDGG